MGVFCWILGLVGEGGVHGGRGSRGVRIDHGLCFDPKPNGYAWMDLQCGCSGSGGCGKIFGVACVGTIAEVKNVGCHCGEEDMSTVHLESGASDRSAGTAPGNALNPNTLDFITPRVSISAQMPIGAMYIYSLILTRISAPTVRNRFSPAIWERRHHRRAHDSNLGMYVPLPPERFPFISPAPSFLRL